MAERLLNLDSIDDALAVLGSGDENIKKIEREFGVCAVCRGTEIKVTGEEAAVDGAGRPIDAMLQL